MAIWDNENKQTIEMISNNFSWAASTIAELYKQRWQIEIFLEISTNCFTSKPSLELLKMQLNTNLDALITILIPEIPEINH